MGSAPVETVKVKTKKSKSPPKASVKKEVPQPSPPPEYKEQVVELTQKTVKMPWKLNPDKLRRVEDIKDGIKAEFRQRFMSNVSKKEARLIFKPKDSKAAMQGSGVFESRILSKFEGECEHDLTVYEEVLDMRMKVIVRDKLKEEENADWNKEGAFERVQQDLATLCREAMVVLLGEAAGKSTVWAQMNLPFEGRKRRVVNFLHAEGVDSSKLEFLGDEECYREYY